MTYTTSSIGNPLGNGLLTEPLTTYRDDSMNSNAFNWSGPSHIGQSHITRRPFKEPALAPKRLHVYTAVTASDASLEAQITQVNREVEFHFASAQTATCDLMRGKHRDEARKLAGKVKALVQSRSAETVERMEAERGLS